MFRVWPQFLKAAGQCQPFFLNDLRLRLSQHLHCQSRGCAKTQKPPHPASERNPNEPAGLDSTTCRMHKFAAIRIGGIVPRR